MTPEPAPLHQVVNPSVEPDRDTAAMLRALRIAHAKLRILILEVEDIGEEIKAGRMTAVEAMRVCTETGLDALFLRDADGA